MNEKKVFADGLRTFAKRDNSPDWILGTLIVDVNAFIAWLNGEGSKYQRDYKGARQVKFDIATTKGDGRVNFIVDTYGLNANDEDGLPVTDVQEEARCTPNVNRKPKYVPPAQGMNADDLPF